MTPKEKAKELIDKFEHETYSLIQGQLSKQCALIAVDEMLTWFKAHSYTTKNYDAFVFYNEVKQEIEAL
jgi:hypothetical protein